jgi:hypothetical protein
MAFLSVLISEEAQKPVRWWLDSAGIQVEEPGGQRFPVREACADQQEIPAEGALALGLVGAMGRSLRAGEYSLAREQGNAAWYLWDGPPTQLARMLLKTLAPRVPQNFVENLVENKVAPGVDAQALQALLVQLESVEQLKGSSRMKSVASAWALKQKDRLLAMRLLSAPDAKPDPLWFPLARELGEPVAVPLFSAGPCEYPFYLTLLLPENPG